MSSTTPTSLFAILCAVALGGCGAKAAPRSTTTTRTQTTTETSTGETSTSVIKETRTKQLDGSEDVVRVTTTKKKVPPTP